MYVYIKAKSHVCYMWHLPNDNNPYYPSEWGWDGGAHSHKRHAFSMNEPRSPLRKGLIDYQPVNLYVGGIEH